MTPNVFRVEAPTTSSCTDTSVQGQKQGLFKVEGVNVPEAFSNLPIPWMKLPKRQKVGLVTPESHLPALPDSISRLNSGASASVWLMDWDEHYLSGMVTWKFVQLSLFMFVG